MSEFKGALLMQDVENARKALEAQDKKVLKMRRELMAELYKMKECEVELQRRTLRLEQHQNVAMIYAEPIQVEPRKFWLTPVTS